MSIPSFAARGSNSICGVNYTNASQFLFNPEGGDLFSNFKGVMPGDNLKQEIVIANQLATKKVTLYLRAEIDEQYKKFLDCIEIEVTLKKGLGTSAHIHNDECFRSPGRVAMQKTKHQNPVNLPRMLTSAHMHRAKKGCLLFISELTKIWVMNSRKLSELLIGSFLPKRAKR